MPGRSEVFTIEKTLPSERLDTFLRARYPAMSRGAIQRLIEEGHIQVNGRTVKPTHTPHAGDEVRVHWPDARPSEVQPEAMPLDVLFEDETLIVINKPAGLVVHPAAGHEEHTLVNALLHHCAGQLSGVGGVARPGIVHRLDKETSGCLVAAKNDDAHLALSAQFAGRTVQKVYFAIVCGEMARDHGEIRAAIARHPSHRKRMAVSDDRGREALTTYEVLERFDCATVVRAVLHTGRTHQIRVHFQHLGYPLAGDLTYGPRQNRRLEGRLGFAAPRVMLHARELAFTHPRTGRYFHFTAPLPKDFEEYLGALRRLKE
ncbi:MAG TPA: RluA family pseudouridine synthase [Verrucomicrobia bacterium]|nr:RluA family pseudouridine synthase [Verrucomicrobiota bacterium]HOB32354.1 RluA family pseudouridine synthase [Verrucomicrobiota bacterium]HOP97047.1 RluA family pseudouridine synthase [Verrucomicrobiota bacterium]HPU56961.1 RluA family pseudouridine synthase [Verrucomicrobiota bacterium]